MNIISASRRTDIPAFYPEWFMGRIGQGFAVYRNPFGGQEHRVSLLPEDVHSIVFWSKNYDPLLSHLPELEKRGYDFCFHFTITGLPQIFEESVPSVRMTLIQFRKLADRYGPHRLFWRYDPILFSDQTGAEHHLETFTRLAESLSGSTLRCYISFAQFYAKMKRNVENLRQSRGIRCWDPADEIKKSLISQMAEISEDNGIALLACCNESLVGGRINKGSCIDGHLLKTLFPHKPFPFKPNPTRPQCACTDSRDIGAYNTCPHGCRYCYANTNKTTAKRNFLAHHPLLEMLL